MKAIETKWKGYRFRSRTEARWAVFLEKLGVAFEYEPEGVMLPSGPYLPDFRLDSFPVEVFPGGRTTQGVWLEVKGSDPSDEEMRKCSELAAEAKQPVLLAIGAPDFGPQIMLFDDEVEDVAMDLFPHLIGLLSFIEVGEGKDAAIAVGRPTRPEDHSEDFGEPDDLKEQFEQMWRSFNGPFARVLGIEGGRFVNDKRINFQLTKRLTDAFDAARSARFEFGQTDKRWPSR
jgi:hypothetical protein